jgi:putative oxidoreductase
LNRAVVTITDQKMSTRRVAIARSTILAPSDRRLRMLRIVLIGIRVLLAVAFAGAGLMKPGGEESAVTLVDDIGAGQWLRYVVGTLEVAAAGGLLFAPIAGTAAFGLVLLMAGATVTRAFLLDGMPAIEIVFLVLSGAIAYDRRADTRSLIRRLLRGFIRPLKCTQADPAKTVSLVRSIGQEGQYRPGNQHNDYDR